MNELALDYVKSQHLLTISEVPVLEQRVQDAVKAKEAIERDVTSELRLLRLEKQESDREISTLREQVKYALEGIQSVMKKMDGRIPPPAKEEQ